MHPYYYQIWCQSDLIIIWYNMNNMRLNIEVPVICPNKILPVSQLHLLDFLYNICLPDLKPRRHLFPISTKWEFCMSINTTIKNCTIHILWRCMMLVVLHRGMGQVFVQFVDQHTQLIGRVTTLKGKKHDKLLIILIINLNLLLIDCLFFWVTHKPILWLHIAALYINM